jgi:L-alanine-DL-glutamate epimerase-like enolase superfamily enzyme
MKVGFYALDLKLKRDFVIAGGQAQHKRNYIVTIDDVGLGEASGSVKYGPFSEEIERDLALVAREFSGRTPAELGRFLRDDHCPICQPAKCAVSTALNDWEAKDKEHSMHEMFGIPKPTEKKTSVTISVGDIESVQQWMAAGYDTIKIKMDASEANLIDVCGVLDVNPMIRIRIDANGSWSYAFAEKVLSLLPADRIEFIEQPFAPEAEADWEKLRGLTAIPLFMDESIASRADIGRVAGLVNGVNIKLQKSGCLQTTVAAMQAAREAHLKVMLGCMIESSVGVAAAYQLSSLADYLDLDGRLLLEGDPFCGLDYDRGNIRISNQYGHGVTVA